MSIFNPWTSTPHSSTANRRPTLHFPSSKNPHSRFFNKNDLFAQTCQVKRQIHFNPSMIFSSKMNQKSSTFKQKHTPKSGFKKQTNRVQTSSGFVSPKRNTLSTQNFILAPRPSSLNTKFRKSKSRVRLEKSYLVSKKVKKKDSQPSIMIWKSRNRVRPESDVSGLVSPIDKKVKLSEYSKILEHIKSSINKSKTLGVPPKENTKINLSLHKKMQKIKKKLRPIQLKKGRTKKHPKSANPQKSSDAQYKGIDFESEIVNLSKIKLYRINSSKTKYSDKRSASDKYRNKSVIVKKKYQFKFNVKLQQKQQNKNKLGINLISKIAKMQSGLRAGSISNRSGQASSKIRGKIRKISSRIKQKKTKTPIKKSTLEIPRSINSNSNRKSHFSISTKKSNVRLPAQIERKSTFGVDREYRHSYSYNLRRKMLLIKLDAVSSRYLTFHFYRLFRARLREHFHHSELKKRRSIKNWKIVKKNFNFKENTKGRIFDWLSMSAQQMTRLSSKVKLFLYNSLPQALQTFIFFKTKLQSNETNVDLILYFHKSMIFQHVVNLYQNLSIIWPNAPLRKGVVANFRFKFKHYNYLFDLVKNNKEHCKNIISKVNYKPERNYEYIIRQLSFLGKTIVHGKKFKYDYPKDYSFFMKKKFKFTLTVNFLGRYFAVNFYFDLKKMFVSQEHQPKKNKYFKDIGLKMYSLDDILCAYSRKCSKKDPRQSDKEYFLRLKKHFFTKKLDLESLDDSDSKAENSYPTWVKSQNKYLIYYKNIIQRSTNIKLKKVVVLSHTVDIDSFFETLSPRIHEKLVQTKRKIQNYFFEFLYFGTDRTSILEYNCKFFVFSLFLLFPQYLIKFAKYRKGRAFKPFDKFNADQYYSRRKQIISGLQRTKRSNVLSINPKSIVTPINNYFIVVNDKQKKEKAKKSPKPIKQKSSRVNRNLLNIPRESNQNLGGLQNMSRITRKLRRISSSKQKSHSVFKMNFFDHSQQFNNRKTHFIKRVNAYKNSSTTQYYLQFFLRSKTALVNSVYGKKQIRCKIKNDLAKPFLEISMYLPRKNDHFFFQMPKENIFSLISKLNVMKRENYLKDLVKHSSSVSRIKQWRKGIEEQRKTDKSIIFFHVLKLKKIARQQKNKIAKPCRNKKVICSQIMGLRLLLSFLNQQKLNSKNFVFTRAKASFKKKQKKEARHRDSIRKEIIRNKIRRITSTFDPQIGANCLKLLNIKAVILSNQEHSRMEYSNNLIMLKKWLVNCKINKKMFFMNLFIYKYMPKEGNIYLFNIFDNKRKFWSFKFILDDCSLDELQKLVQNDRARPHKIKAMTSINLSQHFKATTAKTPSPVDKVQSKMIDRLQILKSKNNIKKASAGVNTLIPLNPKSGKTLKPHRRRKGLLPSKPQSKMGDVISKIYKLSQNFYLKKIREKAIETRQKLRANNKDFFGRLMYKAVFIKTKIYQTIGFFCEKIKVNKQILLKSKQPTLMRRKQFMADVYNDRLLILNFIKKSADTFCIISIYKRINMYSFEIQIYFPLNNKTFTVRLSLIESTPFKNILKRLFIKPTPGKTGVFAEHWNEIPIHQQGVIELKKKLSFIKKFGNRILMKFNSNLAIMQELLYREIIYHSKFFFLVEIFIDCSRCSSAEYDFDSNKIYFFIKIKNINLDEKLHLKFTLQILIREILPELYLKHYLMYRDILLIASTLAYKFKKKLLFLFSESFISTKMGKHTKKEFNNKFSNNNHYLKILNDDDQNDHNIYNAGLKHEKYPQFLFRFWKKNAVGVLVNVFLNSKSQILIELKDLRRKTKRVLYMDLKNIFLGGEITCYHFRYLQQFKERIKKLIFLVR